MNNKIHEVEEQKDEKKISLEEFKQIKEQYETKLINNRFLEIKSKQEKGITL